MAGVFDHLHLKRHTAGSSNELSFDVLDAARNELDDKGTGASRAPKAPKASQGTYHGVAGTSTLSGQAEVERRKKARRARTMRMWAAGVAVVIAAAILAGFAIYRIYEQNLSFAENFDNLIESFGEIDDFLSDVDALMVDPLDADDAQAQEQALGNIPATQQKALEVASEAQKLEQRAPQATDSVALNQVAEAARARADMLDQAQQAFWAASTARDQIAAANAAWSTVLEADQLAREATYAANNAYTEWETTAARDNTSDALDLFNQAEIMLATIQQAHPAIDFSRQLDYLQKKTEALYYAIQTSDALLEGDRGEAAELNDAYNAADQEAARMAENLPLSVEGAVRDGFTQELEPIVEAYDAARTKAIAADATIREYLS